MAQYTHTHQEVIAAYVKVLRELAQLKGAQPPEDVLPLPKAEMVTLLQRSAHPKKEQLIGLLAMFESGMTRSAFLARLVTRPAILTFAYAVAIVVQGASWLWVPISILGGVGAFFAGSKWAWVERWATLQKGKRWLWLLGIELAEIAAIACWGAVWVRLVILSGLYGLYQSAWARPEWFGVVSALLSLLIGYFFSKQFNAFFFFVTQYTSLRQFRGAAVAA